MALLQSNINLNANYNYTIRKKKVQVYQHSLDSIKNLLQL